MTVRESVPCTENDTIPRPSTVRDLQALMAPREELPRIVVLGTGGHAKVVLEILEAAGRFSVLGVVSGDPEAPASVGGYPFLGDFSVLPRLRDDGVEHAAVGVGGWTDNAFRKRVFTLAISAGFQLPPVVHPTAVVPPNVALGAGCVVGSGALLMTEVSIGRNAIVSSGTLIGHETVVGDHALISGGAKVGARVEVRAGAVVAFGATVVSRLVVGENAVVAAGAVAVRDVAAGTRVFGLPAQERGEPADPPRR